MATVFLSYDHDDTERARPIASALEKAGHFVWWDRHIHGGAEYSHEIEAAVKKADAVVVLWSERSVRSAWVRDEAAEGRDQGKLVPVRIDTAKPPMGFRQYQTIALTSGRGRKLPLQMAEVLQAIEAVTQATPAPNLPVAHRTDTGLSRIWFAAVGGVFLLLTIGIAVWSWLARDGLPVVEVAAADASPKSQAAAGDLFIKLGILAQVGEGKWQLVDAASAPSRPNLIFRTADTGSPGKPRANLVLLNGKTDTLLWSREFNFPAGGGADLRQQLALTAGRILACELESREAGGLRLDLLKLFLDACSILAESSFEEPTKASDSLRAIVAAEPRFTPAWGRLIFADLDGRVDPATRQADFAKAEKAVPSLPELIFAKSALLTPKKNEAATYAAEFSLLEKLTSLNPKKSEFFTAKADWLLGVGRLQDAISSSRRAWELDPLSPTTHRDLITTLAYGGQISAARSELERAERMWSGTEALRDALWAFHLRFGDPALARKFARPEYLDEGLDAFLNARADPSPANIDKLIKSLGEPRPEVAGWAIQALGEFNRTDDVLIWIDRTPTDQVAHGSYLFFRPALAGLRKDPRFMKVAKRIALLDYWRMSGMWPDFCSEPSLPYDCKKEAAKLSA